MTTITKITNPFGNFAQHEKINVIENIISDRTDDAIKIIDKHKLDVNTIFDDYKNNLLHLSVKLKRNDMIRYLVSKIDRDQKNIFDETCYDIAMQNQDRSALDLLMETDLINYYKNENLKLVDDNNNLNDVKHELMNALEKLSKGQNISTIQLGEKKKKLKRAREENDVLLKENKRFKSDNIKLKKDYGKLVDDNESLKDTLTSYRNEIKEKGKKKKN